MATGTSGWVEEAQRGFAERAAKAEVASAEKARVFQERAVAHFIECLETLTGEQRDFGVVTDPDTETQWADVDGYRFACNGAGGPLFLVQGCPFCGRDSWSPLAKQLRADREAMLLEFAFAINAGESARYGHHCGNYEDDLNYRPPSPREPRVSLADELVGVLNRVIDQRVHQESAGGA